MPRKHITNAEFVQCVDHLRANRDTFRNLYYYQAIDRLRSETGVSKLNNKSMAQMYKIAEIPPRIGGKGAPRKVRDKTMARHVAKLYTLLNQPVPDDLAEVTT